MGAMTWGQLDEALAGMTWGEVDAAMAGTSLVELDDSLLQGDNPLLQGREGIGQRVQDLDHARIAATDVGVDGRIESDPLDECGRDGQFRRPSELLDSHDSSSSVGQPSGCGSSTPDPTEGEPPTTDVREA